MDKIHKEVLTELAKDFGIFKSNTKPDIERINKAVQFAYTCWKQSLTKQSKQDELVNTFYKVKLSNIGTLKPEPKKILVYFNNIYNNIRDIFKNINSFAYNNYLVLKSKATKNRQVKLEYIEEFLDKKKLSSITPLLDHTVLYRIYDLDNWGELCSIVSQDSMSEIVTVKLIITGNIIKTKAKWLSKP